MKKTLILLMTTVFLACQADQQKKVATKVNPVVENQGAMQTVAPRKATVVSRDSLRPQMRRSTYIQDKSRPKTKIASNFPYDIDLKTADGKIVKSNDVFEQGKPTVLLFWLTTCFPCSVEMAAIEQKYRDWQKEADFQLVALSTDFEKNYPKFVSRVNDKQWPWATYNDVNREFRKVMPGGLNGLPQTFLLDQNGKIVYHKRKYNTGDEDKLFAEIKALASK